MNERWTRNRNNGVKKGLFIEGARDKTVEDIQQMAKKEALRIGFKDRRLIRVRHVEYLAHLDGWIVVVENRW